MDTALLTVPDRSYVLAGATNVAVTMATPGLQCEPTALGLRVGTSASAVAVNLDVLYRPEPDRGAEGWTLSAAGTFDAAAPLAIRTPDGRVHNEFGSFSMIILPSELTFRIFRRVAGDGVEQHLIDMTPFMKMPGQPSGRDDAALVSPGGEQSGDVHWQVGCQSSTQRHSISTNGTAPTRAAALSDLISAGRVLLRREYPSPAAGPVVGMFVSLEFRFAHVRGFDDPTLDDQQLADRILAALDAEDVREQDRQAAAAQWAARPPVRNDTPASSVTEQFSRITAWLHGNVDATVPNDVVPHQLGEKKTHTDVGWPPELREWSQRIEMLPTKLRLSLVPGYELFDATRMRSEQERMVGIWNSVRSELGVDDPASTVAGQGVWTFVPEFVPIAGLNGSFLVVDTRPGELSGCVTGFDKVDTDAQGPQWRSISAMLADLATALETEQPFVSTWRAASVNGGLEWTYDAS